MRMPPNRIHERPERRRESRFNGGRHAHAAESSTPPRQPTNLHASMEGGMRMPPNGR